jgi:hypothetical protein
MKLLRMCCLVLPLFALTANADILGSADAFGVLGASAVGGVSRSHANESCLRRCRDRGKMINFEIPPR